jgi:hypothetical protein
MMSQVERPQKAQVFLYLVQEALESPPRSPSDHQEAPMGLFYRLSSLKLLTILAVSTCLIFALRFLEMFPFSSSSIFNIGPLESLKKFSIDDNF